MFSNQEKQGRIVHRSGILGKYRRLMEKDKFRNFLIQKIMVKGIKYFFRFFKWLFWCVFGWDYRLPILIILINNINIIFKAKRCT